MTWRAPFVDVMPRTQPADARRELTGPVERLAIDLLNNIRGEVRFDPGSRAAYSTDASNYRQVPIGVVVPLDIEDVVTAVEICRSHGAPILSRGGGTSLAGQACNVAVVLDHSKSNNALVSLDPEARRAVVRPGIVLDELRTAAERHHLTFGPDPATHDHCTIGGMIGNNSCGPHSVMAGRTVDNVEALEVLTYDGVRLTLGPTSEERLQVLSHEPGRVGEIHRAILALRDAEADEIRKRYPDIPRRVSGYNLDELLPERGTNLARAVVGSESTLVTVLEATLRLVPSPPARSLVVVAYPDVYAAADDVPRVIDAGCIACEGLDDKLVDDVRSRGLHPHGLSLLPGGGGFLLAEFGGDDRAAAHDAAAAFAHRTRSLGGGRSAAVFDEPADQEALWKVRESGLGATAKVPGKAPTHPGWEDSAVPPGSLGDYLRDLRKLWDRYGYDADMYGHFGQGVLHCRIDFDLLSASGLEHYRAYLDDAADLVVGYGGSLSGEHGDGQARGELLPRMFGDRLVAAFERFKSIWDPDWKMNPGKVVRPNRITDDLRLGTDHHPGNPETFFAFPEDGGSFAQAAQRCVGVGKCRRHGEGVMCPSYMVTREEEHSTRGRARLLFELINGRELEGGWRNQEVEEALDLCLACKGCKHDCPVNVDMATYKAEFRAHHYAGRLRPRAAYSMGLIHWWSRLAMRVPRLANAAAGAPLLGPLAKAIGGIAPERTIPRFADSTFRAWWQSRQGTPDGGRERTPAGTAPRGRVVLWVDTFTDAFHPANGIAAVRLLEDAGFDVAVPDAVLCCGRPLYDWGFLRQARGLLRRTLRELRDDIRAGTPIVGLEPSCISVFRDDGPNLLHGDTDMTRLAGVATTLTELLAGLDDYVPPQVQGSALVQGHCHQKSVLDFEAELSLLRRAGLDVEAPESGCCGMAGAFGFERGDHYRVAMAAGERVLLPAVRDAAAGTEIVAAGFSCREQIDQSTDRTAVHPAALLARGLRDGARSSEVS